MAEGGRELGQVTVDVDVLPLPAPQRLDGKAGAKVVQAWPMAVGWPPSADLACELQASGPYRPWGQTEALFGDEHAGAFRDRIDMVTPVSVATECLLCGRRERQASRRAKRGVAQGEQTVLEIDRIPVEGQQCTDAHARGHQQSEHGARGAGTQPSGCGEAAGGCNELRDLGFAVERRGVALRTRGP